MKPAAHSKTLWLNVATGIGMVASFALLEIDKLPLSDDASAWLLFAIGLVNAATNFVLRLYTYQPLERTAGEARALGLR